MKVSIRIWQQTAGEYIAECVSLPGCVYKGKNKAEAQEGLDEAIRGYLAAVDNFVPENLVQEVVEVHAPKAAG